MINYPNSLWTRLLSLTSLVQLSSIFFLPICLNVARCLYRIDFIVIIIIIGVGFVTTIFTASLLNIAAGALAATSNILWRSFFSSTLVWHKCENVISCEQICFFPSWELHLLRDRNRQVADDFFSLPLMSILVNFFLASAAAYFPKCEYFDLNWCRSCEPVSYPLHPVSVPVSVITRMSDGMQRARFAFFDGIERSAYVSRTALSNVRITHR